MGFVDADLVEGDVDENFLCDICCCLFDEPVSACHEGHTFCKGCLTKALERAESCPTCRAETSVENLVRQRPLENIIAGLRTRCEHLADRAKRARTPAFSSLKVDELRAALGERGLEDGGLKAALVARLTEAAEDDVACDWRGTVSTYKEHLAECPSAESDCENEECEVQLPRCRLPRHHDVCPLRTVECEHCGEDVTHDAMDDHLEECDEVLIECEDCEIEFKRCEIDDHPCAEEFIMCPFYFCNKHRAKRKDMPRHYVEFAEAHAEESSNAIIIAKNMIEKLQNEVRSLRTETTVQWSWSPTASILDGPTGETINLWSDACTVWSGLEYQLHLQRWSVAQEDGSYLRFNFVNRSKVPCEIDGAFIFFDKDGGVAMSRKLGERRKSCSGRWAWGWSESMSPRLRIRCTHPDGKLRIAARLKVTSPASRALDAVMGV